MIYLASQSLRRAELLQQIGVPFQKLRCSIDETPLQDETPTSYVKRMAQEKADEGWKTLQRQSLPPLPLLASDTTVVCDGRILGKPLNRLEAKAMLKSLSGRTHQVITAVTVTNGKDTRTKNVVTDVLFLPLSDHTIEQYILTGEPDDKAGAYGIQGKGALLVDRMSGSYSSVVGLPLTETAELLESFHVTVW